jgi:adenylate kinase
VDEAEDGAPEDGAPEAGTPVSGASVTGGSVTGGSLTGGPAVTGGPGNGNPVSNWDPRVVLLGRQGSGKGTQADRLSELYHVPHISTGEAFRAAVREGSELGRTVQGYMERGELVPDDVVVGVLREHLVKQARLRVGRAGGFILDGFPRNIRQAEALSDLLTPEGLDVVVNLDVSTEEVLRRIAGRRVCPNCGASYNVVNNAPVQAETCDVCAGRLVQRDDDTEEAIRRRLELYESETAPLVDWYSEQGLLATVDASGPPDEVTERTVKAIEAARVRRKGVHLTGH